MSAEDRHLVEQSARHVDHFASQGLRTLVLAKRTLEPAEAEAWLRQFNEAATALTNPNPNPNPNPYSNPNPKPNPSPNPNPTSL